MDPLEIGAMIEAGELQAPGATAGAPIEIRARLGELPHGMRYRARQDGVGVMLTVLDPVFAADPAVWAGLRRDLKAAQSRSHRSLLPIFAFGRSPERHVLILEHDPGGKSIREFVRHRISRGRPMDGDAAYALVAHVCNAIGSLHPEVIHGYVTADTTHVSEGGRVFLSGIGIGRNLPRTPGFARHREEGRLPNVAPEQLLAMPQLSAGTDVFGVATLFLEMVTGRALVEAGQPITALGLSGPDDLLMCLERATAPSPGARPPDATTFKSELAEALRAGPIERAESSAPAAVLLPDVPLAGDSGSTMPKVPPASNPLANPPTIDSGASAPPIPPSRSPLSSPAGSDSGASSLPPVPPPGAPLESLPASGSDPFESFDFDLAADEAASSSLPPLPPTPPAIARSRKPPPPPSSRPVITLDPEDSVPIDLDADESSPSMPSMKREQVAPPPPSPPVRMDPLPEESTSNVLNLSLGDTDDLVGRLSTIDGEEVPPEEVSSPAAKVPQAPKAAAPFDTAATGKLYFIVRGERMDGPVAFTTLRDRAADGELKLTDRIQDRRTGHEHTVEQIKTLAHLIETSAERAELRKFAQSRASVREGPAPAPLPGRNRPKDRRALGTMVWVMLALVGFVAAGWWLTR